MRTYFTGTGFVRMTQIQGNEGTQQKTQKDTIVITGMSNSFYIKDHILGLDLKWAGPATLPHLSVQRSLTTYFIAELSHIKENQSGIPTVSLSFATW